MGAPGMACMSPKMTPVIASRTSTSRTMRSTTKRIIAASGSHGGQREPRRLRVQVQPFPRAEVVTVALPQRGEARCVGQLAEQNVEPHRLAFEKRHQLM